MTEERSCPHAGTFVEGGVEICEECGVVMRREEMNFDREWRYYGMTDTKHAVDPTRCYARKSTDRVIDRDVAQMGFSQKIVMTANQIYDQVTNGKIYRGNSRKGIIFACVFHAYKMIGQPQSCEHLIEVFDMDRRVGLKGLKYVNLNAPKTAGFRHFHVEMRDLIGEIMDKFHATPQQKEEAVQLFARVDQRSMLLNRSRPQSVACGVVRYYIMQKNKDISMEEFQSRVRLSEVTIQRLVNEIARLMTAEHDAAQDAKSAATRTATRAVTRAAPRRTRPKAVS